MKNPWLITILMCLLGYGFMFFFLLVGMLLTGIHTL